SPQLVFFLLDNGIGMSESELTEAMRLATKNPNDKRATADLGRFGMGLKTASFSQCRKLTVISKKNNAISAKQWDLDYLVEKNEWWLITPKEISHLHYYDKLNSMDSGTIICWENIDRVEKNGFSNVIDKLKKHLSMVFHLFLEGKVPNRKNLSITINGSALTPFNPFNPTHSATQEIAPEKIQYYNSAIIVQPYILPHHSKVSRQEYDLYATEEGYLKSQGFYLYRANRILIYGTWWGLHKPTDAHKLVRIKIDIPNDLDIEWGIDVKKSSARPNEQIKNDLKRIIAKVTEIGSRPYTGRGRKIEEKNVTKFWEIIPMNEEMRFGINKNHPLFLRLKNNLSVNDFEMLTYFIKSIEAYLPLEVIQSQLIQNPHLIKQQQALTEEEIATLSKKLIVAGQSQEQIEELLKTELFATRKHLIKNEQ
ncbi:MAG: ATP-binding protein, partial [Chitinophagia bacterium]|nr:ATP-binding protein [Chitinophagia bacterium]